jgi:hypothetical protein
MKEKLQGRRGAVLMATGALLGAIIVGPGGSIAASVMNLNTKTGDKRYVLAGSVLTAGRTIETKQPLAASAPFTSVASTSIKAPVPGLVQVTATISGDDDVAAGKGKIQYQVKVGNTVLNPTDPGAFQLDPAENPNGGRDSGTITGVVKVPAAATVPIQLLAKEAGTGSIVQGRSISAVFVPAGKFPKVKKAAKKPVKPTA